MARIDRFEDLHCWQEARKLVKLIYKITKKEPFNKDRDLVSQVRRSAISSMSNIAEGFHRRSNKEFMKFLDYSRSSIAETVSHCYVALDEEYISQDEMNQIYEQAEIVWKQVNGVIAYLSQSSRESNRRTSRTD
jgi:four helix bundle protein